MVQTLNMYIYTYWWLGGTGNKYLELKLNICLRYSGGLSIYAKIKKSHFFKRMPNTFTI